MNVARLVDLCTVDNRIENVTIASTRFDAGGLPLDALYVEVPDGKAVLGAIGLRNAVITGCRFMGVSFLLTHEQIELFRTGVTAGTIAPPPFYSELFKQG